MKLKSVRLQNFRCFEDMEIDFHERLTVIVGGNGSGKTAVLDAIRCFFVGHKISGGGVNGNITEKSIRNGCETLSIDGCLLANEHIFSLKVYYPYITENGTKYFLNRIDGNIAANLKNDTGEFVFAHYKTERSGLLHFDETVAWFDQVETNEAKEAKRTQNINFSLPELDAVRSALAEALQGYDRPFTQQEPGANTKPVLYMHQKGTDAVFEVSQLSDGYRSMLALVAELARCMADVNAKFYAAKLNKKEYESVLYSPALVLIDEVELHLHPSWQQHVLPDLMRIFPNTQFIVTTHSPQVLSSIHAEHVRILEDGKPNKAQHGTFGAESSRVLAEIFEVPSRPRWLTVTKGEGTEQYPLNDNIDKYFSLIAADQYDSEEAQAIRAKLNEYLSGDPVLVRAEAQIERARRLKKRREGHA